MLTPRLRRQQATDRRRPVEETGEIGIELGVAHPPSVEEAAQRQWIGVGCVQPFGDEGGGADPVRRKQSACAGMVGAARMAEMNEIALAQRGREEGAILGELAGQRVDLAVDLDMAVGVELD